MEYLLQENTKHLFLQRSSVDNAEDARRKYTLRRRMERLLPHFVSREFDSGPFKLVCDDLQPGNIMVDPESLEIVALIDLEWTYADPHQFLFSPPSWLIVDDPINWMDKDVDSYKAKFEIFIKSLEEEEHMEVDGRLHVQKEQRMSALMRRSWKDDTFWLEQLLRESFNFHGDRLWPYLERVLQSERPELLDNPISEDEDVETFMKRKMEDLRQYKADLQSLSDTAEATSTDDPGKD